MKRFPILFLLLFPLIAAASPAEDAARALAGRIVPAWSGHIRFVEQAAQQEFYEIRPDGDGIIILGSGANSLCAGLGRYLCESGIDVSWYASRPVELPDTMPLPPSVLRSEALVPLRFFLNYCTFGYTMPWWHWEEWERFIDWMALNGVNLPLAITGQEAVWQEVWKQFGLTDDEIRSYFTGPAHLPWHRMNNIDGFDGPLPQGWIDGQAALQEQIVRRERELGMRPVLPAFSGHVPGVLKERHPEAEISDVSRWCGFAEEYRCHFLSPTDPLYPEIQKAFLEAQTRLFGTDHIYGFDLFNEVEAPSWDPGTLAAIGKGAWEALAAADPDAEWLQMGWMFYNDRRHWTDENVRAYLEAVPKGKVLLLDYYTEHTPIWTLTEAFYGQPYIFCYLGNFGGNTRLAGPFREESRRIGEALSRGGNNLRGIGCTLEGFGINRWFYEYVLSRAWNTGVSDDAWLTGLGKRHGSPDGFWRELADSVYLRGSFSEGSLMGDRPCEEKWHSWRVINTLPYEPAVLERAWQRLLASGHGSASARADIAEIGTTALGNGFMGLRERFVAACRAGKREEAARLGEEMIALMERTDALAATHPEMRADRWIAAAESWATSPEEKAYYRRNAWRILTTWGHNERLGDYASRLWSGLISKYYIPRWRMFIEEELRCMEAGVPFDKAAFNARCWAWEQDFVARAPSFPSDEMTLMSYNVGVFSKYRDSRAEVAELLRERGVDMAALNELDSCNRRHVTFQLEDVARMLGREYHFASAFPFAGGAYGNGIIAGEPILRRWRIDLPQLKGSEPRSVAVVETDRCVFASAHLDVKASQKEQARILSRWFRRHFAGYGKPVFLCGDMNSVPESDAVRELEKHWERLSPAGVTRPNASGGGKCIDYIFRLRSSAPARVLHSEIISAGTNLMSDHYPVLVKVKIQ